MYKIGGKLSDNENWKELNQLKKNLENIKTYEITNNNHYFIDAIKNTYESQISVLNNKIYELNFELKMNYNKNNVNFSNK